MTSIQETIQSTLARAQSPLTLRPMPSQSLRKDQAESKAHKLARGSPQAEAAFQRSTPTSLTSTSIEIL